MAGMRSVGRRAAAVIAWALALSAIVVHSTRHGPVDDNGYFDMRLPDRPAAGFDLARPAHPLASADQAHPPVGRSTDKTGTDGKFILGLPGDDWSDRSIATARQGAPVVRSKRQVAPANLADAIATSTGLTTLGPGRFRPLAEWEMHNIVLLASVDGTLHARRRETGEPVWTFVSNRPLVQVDYPSDPPDPAIGPDDRTQPHRRTGCGDADPFVWVVEPAEDGAIFVLAPGPGGGLQSLGVTIRQLADMSPYASDDGPFVYTADRKKTLFWLNATDGTPLQYFSTTGAAAFELGRDECRPMPPLEAVDRDRDSKCSRQPTVAIGRADYTVAIHHRMTGQLAATIRYTEWTPNSRDQDLQAQHRAAMDHRYIYSRHDGAIIAVEYDGVAEPDELESRRPAVRLLYNARFSNSPVVQVFDVAVPVGASAGETAAAVLRQPAVPHAAGRVGDHKLRAVFLNQTGAGTWFAMSEARFPSVTDGASTAPCYLPDGSFVAPPAGPDQCRHLVGVHQLTAAGPTPFPTRLTIDGPSLATQKAADLVAFYRLSLLWQAVLATLTVFKGLPRLPSITALSAILVTFIVAATTLHTYQRGADSQLDRAASKAGVPALAEAVLERTGLVDQPAGLTAEPAGSKSVRFADRAEIELDREPDRELELELEPEPDREPGLDPEFVRDGAAELVLGSSPPDETAKPAKKKTHRGQRGGRRRKKKSLSVDMTENIDPAEQLDDKPAGERADDAGGDGDDTTEINNLVITKSVVLGHGSGGTTVFEGRFEDRRVAVKRLLLESCHLASQEVDLLRQSDDHSNVIRYFCSQKDDNFLYIALELCQASVWDLFQDGQTGLPDGRAGLAAQVQRHVVVGLYQLASGLNHLHSLRIVHRDIKPQNILVAFSKRTPLAPPIRLVISDFGLCKTLPDNASTLIGTTANAGTVGWKAPELIVRPRPGEGRSSSGSADTLADSLDGPTGVKRAVDVFSLGCVFFYLLTGGAHPFDNDDAESWHSLREVNIKKGRANFGRLRALGPDVEEPLHLINWMLAPVPQMRPTASQVMNHPFFWPPLKRLAFICDVSDHWERECRDPPSEHLVKLESHAAAVLAGCDWTGGSGHPAMANPDTATLNFLARLPNQFVETLGKQRKYCGDRLLDLLRALRNKRNHYDEMPADLRTKIGPLPDGYLEYWTSRFPVLVMACWQAVRDCDLGSDSRFRTYMCGDD